MAKKQDKVLLDLAVAFNGVSIGESTARIGVTVDRSLLELKRGPDVLARAEEAVRAALKEMQDKGTELGNDWVRQQVGDPLAGIPTAGTGNYRS